MSIYYPTKLTIEDNYFPAAWSRAVRYIANHGYEVNNAKEVILSINLSGEAINQVINHVVHPQYPFGKNSINEYCKEFTYEYVKEYEMKGVGQQFSYLYFQRFARYPIGYGYIDQIACLRNNLRSSTKSRQLQMVTYIPPIDMESENPPCLQRIQVRELDDKYVDLHYEFRSWDVYGAMPSNIIAITEMMIQHVLQDEYTINSINVNAVSGHVYDSDSGEAKKVRKI